MTQQNLPAHLQRYQTRDVGAALSANLGSAMPPHVSIAGGRFTLVDASNNELPGAWFDQKLGVYIDACVVDVNEHLSRMYFPGAYDANAEGVRPDCFSDNGVGPSVSAQSPQAPSCTPDPTGQWGCKWAVWGSKINQNGKKVPACSQKQKVALLIPGYNILFLLAIPPNSHGPLREYTEHCKGHGINMADVLTRIYFKPGEVGTLCFQGLAYIDEATAELRQAAWNEKKTDSLVGRNDTPRPGPAMVAAPVQQAQIAPPVQSPTPVHQIAAQWPPQESQPAMQQTAPQTQQWPVQTQQPAQQAQQPSPFVATSAAQNFPPTTSSQAAPAQSASNPEPAPAGRRRRRTAAEMQAAHGAAPAGQQVQQPAAAPQAPFPHPGQSAQGPAQTDMGFGIAQGQPAAANPELAGMLDDFFKQG